MSACSLDRTDRDNQRSWVSHRPTCNRLPDRTRRCTSGQNHTGRIAMEPTLVRVPLVVVRPAVSETGSKRQAITGPGAGVALRASTAHCVSCPPCRWRNPLRPAASPSSRRLNRALTQRRLNGVAFNVMPVPANRRTQPSSAAHLELVFADPDQHGGSTSSRILELNAVHVLLEPGKTVRFSATHSNAGERGEARLLKSLMIEISIPRDKNAPRFHCCHCHQRIGRVGRHYLANPHDVMSSLGQEISDRVGHVVVRKKSDRKADRHQAAESPICARAAFMSSCRSSGNSRRTVAASWPL